MEREAFFQILRYLYYLGLIEMGGWYANFYNEMFNGDTPTGRMSSEYTSVSATIDTYKLIGRLMIGIPIARFILLRYVLK